MTSQELGVKTQGCGCGTPLQLRSVKQPTSYSALQQFYEDFALFSTMLHVLLNVRAPYEFIFNGLANQT
jgi:hypothetical protein